MRLAALSAAAGVIALARLHLRLLAWAVARDCEPPVGPMSLHLSHPAVDPQLRSCRCSQLTETEPHHEQSPFPSTKTSAEIQCKRGQQVFSVDFLRPSICWSTVSCRTSGRVVKASVSSADNESCLGSNPKGFKHLLFWILLGGPALHAAAEKCSFCFCLAVSCCCVMMAA